MFDNTGDLHPILKAIQKGMFLRTPFQHPTRAWPQQRRHPCILFQQALKTDGPEGHKRIFRKNQDKLRAAKAGLQEVIHVVPDLRVNEGKAARNPWLKLRPNINRCVSKYPHPTDPPQQKKTTKKGVVLNQPQKGALKRNNTHIKSRQFRRPLQRWLIQTYPSLSWSQKESPAGSKLKRVLCGLTTVDGRNPFGTT